MFSLGAWNLLIVGVLLVLFVTLAPNGNHGLGGRPGGGERGDDGPRRCSKCAE